MRKYFFYLWAFVCLFLTSCNDLSVSATFYVHNVTDNPIFITSNDKHLSDTIAVEPGEYAKIGYEIFVDDMFLPDFNLGVYSIYDMYIGYDDVFYRVDTTDTGSCYWPRAYRPATDAEYAMLGEANKYWARYVYDLTEEFILDQIKE